MPGNIGMLSANDFTYLTHIVDESFLVNALPITVKKITDASKAVTDDLFDEINKKEWDKSTLNAVVVNRPMKEILDRYATRNPVKLIVSVSYLELQRKGWTLKPTDVFEWSSMDGKTEDYFIESVLPDGLFRDTNGNQHSVSYTVLLNNEKVPTNGRE